MFQLLYSNTFPSKSHGGKSKKWLDFSLQAQLFWNLYSLTLGNVQSVFHVQSVLELFANMQPSS